MMERLEAFVSRIPWRLLVALLGGTLVVRGGANLLSVELPADTDEVIRIIKQGMAMVVGGGVVLIAAIIAR